jgi:hypothetical protein
MDEIEQDRLHGVRMFVFLKDIKEKFYRRTDVNTNFFYSSI